MDCTLVLVGLILLLYLTSMVVMAYVADKIIDQARSIIRLYIQIALSEYTIDTIVDVLDNYSECLELLGESEVKTAKLKLIEDLSAEFKRIYRQKNF